MNARIWALTCGEITFSHEQLRSSERGMLRVPVPSYLIEHPAGTLVFDTGLSPRIRDDFDGYVADHARTDREFHFGAEDDISSKLRGSRLRSRVRRPDHQLPSPP